MSKALPSICYALPLMLVACATPSNQDPAGTRSQNPAADNSEELAKKLANPVAALISVPILFEGAYDVGPTDEGIRNSVTVQPVVPFDLNDDWNVISRTILPIVSQDDVFPGTGSQTGLGDTVQSVFFSPKQPTAGGWTWGAGPVFLLPTATDDLLGAEKWATGPTAVALRQQGPWTYGLLTNHLWSFAGEEDRADVSSTLLQPFVSYTTPSAWTYNLNTESSYDWEREQWTVPVLASLSKVVRLGGQLASIGGSVRYWADAPDEGAEGFGFRITFTLLFPR